MFNIESCKRDNTCSYGCLLTYSGYLSLFVEIESAFWCGWGPEGHMFYIDISGKHK